ncbi:MAG: hypothetical protein Roseis2KO_47460 [Roseivirga sp.]
MKATSFSLILFSCLLFSCANVNSTVGNADSTFIVSTGQIGLIKQMMTVQEVLDTYPSGSIKKVTSQGEFAEDQYDDYEVHDSEGRHIFTFTPVRNNDPHARIESVTILDERFKTDKGIGLSSTYGQLTEAYEALDCSPDMETIDISITRLKARFSIQKSDLEEGWWKEREKEIDTSKIPTDTSLSGFLIQW